MSLATQFAGAIELAQFYELNDLSAKLWKAHSASHLTDDEAQGLAEAIEAKRPKRSGGDRKSKAKNLHLIAKPKPQRSPDKQASIERRRRLARQSPVPPELVGEFTQGEHAVMTVVAGEIQRRGLCAWYLDKIAAIAGVCRSLARNAMRKGRKFGLLYSEERRRRGQKSLSNIIRVLRRSWGHWLKWIGGRKIRSTTDIDTKTGKTPAANNNGDSFREPFGSS
jgi:hypothetical protein